MPTTPHEPRTDAPWARFKMLWLCETIRVIESRDQPMEDAASCREARRGGGDFKQRLVLRNLALARREGLDASLDKWLQRIHYTFAGWLFAEAMLGVLLARLILGGKENTVNVLAASLFAVLPNALFLILAACIRLSRCVRPAPASLGWSGQLFLNSSRWRSRLHNLDELAAGFLELVHADRAWHSALGHLFHAAWLIAFVSALTTTVILLSVQGYAFSWQTTIASPELVTGYIRLAGAPGAVLGFPVPDAELVRTSLLAQIPDDPVRQAWGLWLVGVVLTWGVLLRALLTGFDWVRWRAVLRRADINPALPGYARHQGRLMLDQSTPVVVDPAPTRVSAPPSLPDAKKSDANIRDQALLVGFELTEPPIWPVPPPPGVVIHGNVADYAAQQALLEALPARGNPPVILAIDARRSPDRGTIWFITELAAGCAALRIWLLHGDADAQRLDDWRGTLSAAGLDHTITAPWLQGAGTHNG